MKIIILITFNVLQLKCKASPSYVTFPIVSVNQGLIMGSKEHSISGKEFYSFRSIPYAEPPVGKLRFKEPVALKSWNGVLNGTKSPEYCLQYKMFDYAKDDKPNLQPLGKEDCLVLNVHTPEINSKAKYPVMIFIHGGAFVSGRAEVYTPYILMNENITLVVIQYRLGIFGFLSTEDKVMPGNMGLKDQQLALKFINENIIKFGGDPNRVTLFGESAGGASVHLHMLSPDSKGLFQRAIMQSGTSLCPWSYNNNHRIFALNVGHHFNCSLNDGTEDYLNCLQSVDAQELLLYSAETVKWGISPLYVLPRVDGTFLPDTPSSLMKKNKYSKVEVMAGINKDEGSFVMIMYAVNPSLMNKLNSNFDEYAPYSLILQDEINAAQKTKNAYKHYLKRDDLTLSLEDDQQLLKLYSDRYFVMCHDTVAKTLADDGDVTLYLYQLDHVGFSVNQNFPTLKKYNWTGHVDDLFYMFNEGPFFSKLMVKESDLKLRDIIVKSWTNFAKFGNPNSPDFNFTWKEATADNFSHLSLTPNPRMVGDTYEEIRQFWSNL